MEKITDYSLAEFLGSDIELVEEYLPILELLPPIKDVADPVHPAFGRVTVTPVKELSFGKVITIRNLMNESNIESILQSVSIVTKLPIESVRSFTIIPFYSIINGIIAQLTELSNMEINELAIDDEDIEMIEAQATERMSKFGILNTIDSLAGGDITKWKDIEELPYMVVFTKLMMEKTKGEIKRDVRVIQQRKNKI